MAALTPSGSAAVPPTIGCLEGIVRALPNTAPGLDGISAKVVKNVWRAAPREFHWVYSKCVEEGIFPDVWKNGRLVVIPKGNDRSLTDPKAYRPITLLPIFGKILERVLLRCTPSLMRGISDYQHGFSPGRSTVTALQDVFRTTNESQRKYVQAVFLDISGAFDNAWWPMILLKAKQGGISPNIYRMLVDYFTNRRVGIFVGECVEWKNSTMGCPQGSVLGPTLWNLLLDDLLRLPFPPNAKMIAYADDVTLLIEANSRADIEGTAKSALEMVESWGERNRLSFSPAKSCTMTLKGRFLRPPVIRMGSNSIKSVEATKVLGVTLDTSQSFIRHAKDMGDRAGKCFGKMSRVSASSWGIRYPALRVLYNGTYVPIITYAAAVWVNRVGNYTVRTSLLRSQRPSLVLLTKGYRTISTAALPVLAGVLPADLEVTRAGRIDLARAEVENGELSRRKREIWVDVLNVWQERWTKETNGRELFCFFPDVSARLNANWVVPDYQVSQILSGHGCFRKRLYEMKLAESGMCDCGVAYEDRHHVLWECTLYDDLRCKMMDGMVRRRTGPVYYPDLVDSKESFGRLREFAHGWHARRSALER